MAFRRDRRPERRGTPADLLVIGLGNPGAQYEGTRHNVGFDTVELLARRHDGKLKPMKGVPALVEELRMGEARVAVAEPTTYMNRSGEAAGPLLRRFGIEDPQRLVIVHDEMDLPVGRMKVKIGGGLAGHKGLRSVSARCGTDDYLRIRIGVGKPSDPGRGADHVLRTVPVSEREQLDAVVGYAADAVEAILDTGPEAARDRFNGTVVE